MNSMQQTQNRHPIAPIPSGPPPVPPVPPPNYSQQSMPPFPSSTNFVSKNSYQ